MRELSSLSSSQCLFWISTCLLLLEAHGFYLSIPRISETCNTRWNTPSTRQSRSSIGMVLESQASSSAISSSSTPTVSQLVQLERDIVNLGRRGNTDEAIALYKSIARPTVRFMNGAIDACARARPTRLEQAFDLMQDGISHKQLQPNVFTFGALLSACSRARNVNRAMQVLRSMQETYGVRPNAVVYSSAISACARTDPADYQLALELLKEATVTQALPMSVVGYNAALSACAKAGQWQPAIQLLEDMEASPQNGPSPDAVTYGTVLAACERGEQWDLVLKYANRMQERKLPLDGLSVTSVLHACQQLGMANDALQYLELMKTCSLESQERKTSGWKRTGVRQPLTGPDAVAYRLVISACARGGQWQDGIQLLEELRQVTGSPPDVVAYTSAITGCEYAGEWKRAFGLLDTMRKDGIEPNEVTMAAVIGSCATACANASRKFSSSDEQVAFPKKKALQLLYVMKKDATVVNPNIVVYNAAIRACAEGMDLDRALALLEELEMSHDLEPTVFTFGSLMTACERVGSVDGVSKVFRRMKDFNIQPNEIIYGAAISCCRKAGDSERALLLLRKMIREELAPNVATFNTVIVAQTEGRSNPDLQRAVLVFKLMKSKYAPDHARPNRQTYHILIRAFATHQQPHAAETLLRKMQSDGFVPDVDLYTATVTSYERNRQPLQALRLMESMQEVGYDFYDVKVLNEAFKKAVTLVNVVGRGLGQKATGSVADDMDDNLDFDIDRVDGDDDAFIKGKKVL